jgi:hypothetical protein
MVGTSFIDVKTGKHEVIIILNPVGGRKMLANDIMENSEN